MNETQTSTQDVLATITPFDRLSAEKLREYGEAFQLLRYRLGQPILRAETLPYQIAILVEGQARLLGNNPLTRKPITLKRLEAGDILGWAGLIRGVPCESAIASAETTCLALPAHAFLDLLDEEPLLSDYFYNHCSPAEIFDLLNRELQKHPRADLDFKTLVQDASTEAEVRYLQPEEDPNPPLDSQKIWLVSGGGAIVNHPVGSRLDPNETAQVLSIHPARAIGIPASLFEAPKSDESAIAPLPRTQTNNAIPYAPDRPPTPEFVHPFVETPSKRQNYPYVRGDGPVNATLACFQMLAQHLEIPFRRDVIQRILTQQMQRTGSLSLQLCGAVAEPIGLQAQLIQLPASRVSQLHAPALIHTADSIALLFEINAKELVVGIPERGIVRYSPHQFLETLLKTSPDDPVQVLLLQPTKNTPQQKFGLSWFWPSLRRYRGVLLVVFCASFFVQLFALVNPLMIQVIIDRVIARNSIDTLHVLGGFLVLIAIVEAILTSLRTYLFVDTTNRIDLTLGSEIIDHLLRLPLRYFEKRPVGELSSRVNELENIRSFLTGTALTVVLDAVFSVVYIVVMLIYSWLLTLVALATIPLFV
ncbi:MAG: ABC transporter transmembrane domain-containing protein, partial [Cyanobacteriota bacterium]|nr:ABC transporter transmembrane domain-containing protein [Cyanobacteriota bacterium]